jgi:hypothetical protein
MNEVGRLDFLEMILQTFTIDSGWQRVAISSAEISWGTSRTTTEKVGFLEADAGPGVFLFMGGKLEQNTQITADTSERFGCTG